MSYARSCLSSGATHGDPRAVHTMTAPHQSRTLLSPTAQKPDECGAQDDAELPRLSPPEQDRDDTNCAVSLRTTCHRWPRTHSRDVWTAPPGGRTHDADTTCTAPSRPLHPSTTAARRVRPVGTTGIAPPSRLSAPAHTAPDCRAHDPEQEAQDIYPPDAEGCLRRASPS
jgi:hypothetical protein